MPSFAIPKFIILLGPLWVPADFLLLSTGPNLDGTSLRLDLQWNHCLCNHDLSRKLILQAPLPMHERAVADPMLPAPLPLWHTAYTEFSAVSRFETGTLYFKDSKKGYSCSDGRMPPCRHGVKPQEDGKCHLFLSPNLLFCRGRCRVRRNFCFCQQVQLLTAPQPIRTPAIVS